jgi:hypothetical protein
MLDSPPQTGFTSQEVSTLEPKAIDWFWPGRLAYGKLAILDGDPGLGKSLLTLDLCARLSLGLPFPDGTPCGTASASLIINGEDGASDTIRPRLDAAGADLTRVHVMSLSLDKGVKPFRLPTHAEDLSRTIQQTAARLVIIDPIMAFFDTSVAVGSDQNVRQALAPLADMAERTRSVILLVRHLNKLQGFHALYRGGGSIGIVGACRSGWLLVRDPYDPDRRVLAQVKNNLGEPQPSLTFAIAPGPSGKARLHWLGNCAWSADQLLAEARQSGVMTALERAKDFLSTILVEGPLTSRDIWKVACRRRVSARTLRLAREELEIRTLRTWAEGKRLSYWLLPHQTLPAHIPPDCAQPDLEKYLKPIREAFPEPTPID